ncbi:redox-regulated ATPase YchF, partial [Patescibacteria group bacterium]|nr:redox-regulated ATPase YchF [Patescibacteria group bacterium]
TAIEFVDIAGLVRGAHKGEGLGNKFLANIREVDMIVHVIRAFSDPNVTHTEGEVDPARDAEVIELELAMADLVTAEKHLDRLRGKAKAGMTKDLEKDMALCKKLIDGLGKGKLVNQIELEDDERALIKHLNLLTGKPILVVLNVDEDRSDSRKAVSTDALTGVTPDKILPISVKVESELVDLPEAEQVEFMKELGLEQSGLDRLISSCYKSLNLISFLTSGPEETRAWTVTRGTKAPQAAGVIHTDFEKGFIRVEVINWQDFVDLGENGAKESGKMRIEGKDYVIQDGDTCHFRIA